MLNRLLFLERKLFVADNSPTTKTRLNAEQLDYTEVKTLHYRDEEWFGQSARALLFERIYRACDEFRPRLVMLDANEVVPGVESWFKRIRSDFGCKICIQFFYLSNQMKLALKWLPIADFLSIGEHSSYCRQLNNPKCFFSAVPPDLPLIRPGTDFRDIDVCFLGDIRMHSSRRKSIDFLKANEVNVMSGGGGKGWLPANQYFGSMARSKMVMNFCAVPHGKAVLKGRPFEVLACNTLLLEEYGSELDRLFVPGKEFVFFRDNHELLTHIRYYLANPEERAAIAQRGHEKYLRLYNQRHVWAYNLKRQGFAIPSEVEANPDFQEYVRITDLMAATGADKPLRIHRNEQWLRVGLRPRRSRLFRAAIALIPKPLRLALRKLLYSTLTLYSGTKRV